MKVLIVEDNEDSRILLVDQLQIHGYEVESATNGVEALQIARKSPPDLIISDILMPEMDGFELCRQVKRDSILKNLPFIFYTATYTSSEDKRFALSLGASRFVIKPEDPAKFLVIIEEVLSKHNKGELTVPVKPSTSDEVIEHLHAEALSKKLDKKLRELEKQKEHLQLITDAMPVLMSDIDRQYRYRYVNKTYEQWYKMSRSKIIGMHVRDVIGEEAFSLIKPNLDQALNGEQVIFETLLPMQQSPQRYILARYIPHKGDGENVTGLFELVSDITERKQAEQELQLHREHLEELVAERSAQLLTSNKELEAFCYSVSHDLRAPLRGVSGFSQVLMEDYAESLDSTAKEYLDRIRKGVLRMDELIDDLLTLSRVSRREFNKNTINLSKLAEEVVKNLQYTYPESKVQFNVEDNLTVKGDAGLLRIALENLLDNAWKFTANSANPIVELGSINEEGKQVFYIRDNGVGFNMEYVDNLFGAFQRLHEDDEYPGTGIGLATVQRIIQRHGGEVWAKGEVNKGASFYFSFPD